MASPSELTLDCKPHSYSMLLKSFGDHQQNNNIDQTQKLEDFLSRLEEERLKIDAFKRELPLCMQLLTNALEASRQQLQAYRGNQGSGRPVLEEFIPLKNTSSENNYNSESMSSDKTNWMTSAQLWSQATAAGNNNETKPQPLMTISPKESTDHNMTTFNVSPKLGLDTTLSSKHRNGGAFLPFSKVDRINNSCHQQPLPDLALAAAAASVDSLDTEDHNNKKCLQRENSSGKVIGNGGTGVLNIDQGKGISGNTNNTSGDGQSTITINNGGSSSGQPHRKTRRCWSPDLHRRFVNALQMLGGSQVATPKQIRELMKVDGLTNDEVKSHLQKYRLHTRRPSPSLQAAGAPTPQLVVLGGIWVPPEYATAAAHNGAPAALYGAHPHHHHLPGVPLAPPPPHFCASPEFYNAAAAAAAATPSAPAAPSQLLHHHHHHQFHMYKNTSQAHSSPESDIRGAGDRSESIEDGKTSESSSWKGESGSDNGTGGNNTEDNQRKGLAALREGGEQSNGSEITLKF